MNDRDCRTCAYSRATDDMYDNGCTAWDCEYINRDEAIEAYETLKAMRAIEKMMGKARIDQYGYIPKGE